MLAAETFTRAKGTTSLLYAASKRTVPCTAEQTSARPLWFTPIVVANSVQRDIGDQISRRKLDRPRNLRFGELLVTKRTTKTGGDKKPQP